MTAARTTQRRGSRAIHVEPAPVEVIAADARSNDETEEDGTTAALLAGQTVYVLPARDWRASAVRAMRQGDFDTWAEKCLTEESYEVWQEIDPTIGEVEQFFVNWQEATGESPGKSRRPRASSRSTRKR